MAVRSAKQKAALRKAQLASAKKRKRRAVVRNVGRGVAGKKNGSRKRRYKIARYAGAAAAVGAVAYGRHKLKQHLKTNNYRASVVRSHPTRKVKRAGFKYNDFSKSPIQAKGVGGHIHFKGRDYRYQAYKHKR